MTEVINLGSKRKAKARTEKEKKASQNRIKFGRTGQEKKLEKLKVAQAEKRLEGHRLKPEENE